MPYNEHFFQHCTTLSNYQVQAFNDQAAPLRKQIVSNLLHDQHIKKKSEEKKKKKEDHGAAKKKTMHLEMQQALRGQLLNKQKEAQYKALHIRKENVENECMSSNFFFTQLGQGVQSRSNSSGSNDPGRKSWMSSPGPSMNRPKLRAQKAALQKSNSSGV